jgi:hypothetical protein
MEMKTPLRSYLLVSKSILTIFTLRGLLLLKENTSIAIFIWEKIGIKIR